MENIAPVGDSNVPVVKEFSETRALPEALSEHTGPAPHQQAQTAHVRAVEACPQVLKQATSFQSLPQQSTGDDSKHVRSGECKNIEARTVPGSKILSKNAIAAAAVKKASNKLAIAKAEGWDSDSDLDLSQF